MATKQTGHGPKGNERWRARVKEDWTEHYLGTFDSKDEAERVKEAFRAGK